MKPNRATALALLASLVLGLNVLPATAQTTDPVEPEVPHVLMFSGTYGFRHGSIEHSVEVVTELAASTGAFTVTATEDPAAFTAEAFESTDIILFANTTGETPFSAEQKAMFQSFVAEGGGFMGIHAAADTNYEWPFYQELVGAAFESHPHTGMTAFVAPVDELDEATVQVESPEHPINAGTDVDSFELREEYYRWQTDPRGTQDVRVLLSLDETSTTSLLPPSSGQVNPAYEDDQPVEWVKSFRGQNRVWYTNLGHYDATYDDAQWQDRFVRAVQWVHAGSHFGPGTPDEEPTSSGVDGVFLAGPGGASTGFATPAVILPQGSTASFTNLDNVEHNVEAERKDPVTKRPIFRSEFVNGPGGMTPIVGIQPLTPGDYVYFCNIHSSMRGTLTITE